MKRIVIVIQLLWVFGGRAQTAADSIAGKIATIGEPLPAWKPGYLDLHHINTGRGNAAFFILPDGTTILFDAGELDPTNPRTMSRRNTPIRPDDSRRPFEWIAGYIRQVAPAAGHAGIDYAVISHFHDDHFGSWYPDAPLSTDGKFVRTGIPGVGDLIPIHCLLTRDYSYPVDMSMELRKASADRHFQKTWENYLAFLADEKGKGMKMEFLRAGSRTQIRMVHEPMKFANCYVQNIKSNGWIWTGKDSSAEQHFPPIDTADRKTWPDENPLSNVILIRYGPFCYYTGGDCPGNVFLGDAPWRDVETPVARAVGPVDVATMDHHGNRDAESEFFVRNLRPRVWVEQVWTADHPGHEVLIRTMSPLLYPGPRDLFATNMMEANELVIGPLVDQAYKSKQGHIVVRVLPGGRRYYVIILDDSQAELKVKKVFGPYESKGN
jgi:beta-lactamase superfamily II metal-dependent hydrolase